MSKPTVKIPPYEQGKLLYDNVKQNNANLYNIFANFVGMLKDIVSSPAPCELSKYFTHQVCRINDKTMSLSKGDIDLGIVDFKKIKKLANNSKSIVQNILNDPNSAKQEDINRLEGNIDQISQINARNTQNLEVIDKIKEKAPTLKNIPPKTMGKMKGGNNVYNYIVNPKTNRKVRVDSVLGKNILKNYYIQSMR